MATERPNRNPYSAFNFIVEIDGQQMAAFQEVSGLDSENTPIEYREGADAMNTVRKLPGIEKYPNLTLKRGITGSLALWDWRKKCAMAARPSRQRGTSSFSCKTSDMRACSSGR